MNEVNKTIFPLAALPEDLPTAKLMGLYPQRQEGLWMQRIRIPGGRLSADQWRGLAMLAAASEPARTLHLTTRQDVELHDLTPSEVGPIHRDLARWGLTTLAAGGDSVRNMTVCPCGGLRAGSVDLYPLAQTLDGVLASRQGVFSLPRKFKITLACSDECGQPWINDLGLVARKRDGQWGFRAIVAGSLGPKPATGLLLADWVAPADVPALVAAAVAFFADHGDRQNRRAARLRHVRERMGDASFAEAIRQEWDRQRRLPWPSVELTETTHPAPHWRELSFANGIVSAAQAQALADLARQDGLHVRISCRHSVFVFAADAERLRRALAGQAALSQPAEAAVRIVACPGNRWCSRGLADTHALADRLRQALAGRRITPVIRISGCPNGCAQSGVGEIAFSGASVAVEGGREDRFTLLVGGGDGRDNRLAQRATPALTVQQALAEVERHLHANPSCTET